MNNIKYPRYKILPWETEQLTELGTISYNKKYKQNPGDKRDEDQKLTSSISGMICEYVFTELMASKQRNRVLFSSIEQGKSTGEFNAPQDLILKADDGRELSVDVKATSNLTSTIVKTPENCNFVLSYSLSQRKKWYGNFCDYYVQMFWDTQEDWVYFIGALTGKTVEEFVDRKRTPERRGKTSLILQEHFDATSHLLPLIDDKYKLIQKDKVYKKSIL
jgi:hypothetical protein